MTRKLYMAKSIEELQDRASLPNGVPLAKLLKSTKKIFDAAQISYRDQDEEKAYVMYMKILLILQKIQKSGTKEQQKEKTNSSIGSGNVKKALERMEVLQSSLTKRYNIEYSVPETKEINIKHSVKKKLSSSPKSIEIADGAIGCKKLYSLINQKSTSFLVVDIRPKYDFEITSIDIHNVINIGEEVIKPHLTADSAGRELDIQSRLLWNKRASYDFLIICDKKSESIPFSKPVYNIIDAILKWDPGKQYKSKPHVLSGGFELFSMMYPMLINNPQPNQENNHFTPIRLNSELNFEYPDLDTGFVESPSTPNSIKISTFDQIPLPAVDRNLKPFPNSPQFVTEVQNDITETTSNGVSILVEKFDSMMAKPNVQEITKNKIMDGGKQPEVPCRTSKPKELLERFKANKINFDKEQKTLELSMENEKDTLEKLEDIEITKKKKDATENINQKHLLVETEQRLKEDVANLKRHSEKLESDYAAISKQNQQMWQVIREFIDSEEVSTAKNSLKEEDELVSINNKIEEMSLGLNIMRKKRKEKEIIMAREKEILDEKEKIKPPVLQNITNRFIEHPTRPNDNRNTHQLDNMRKTNLNSTSRPSPIRGGTNLRRSHSAVNIAELRDDESMMETIVMPSFDRRLKPMESSQKRTVNAARQRNFEPKIGNVGSGKTGLKNLGNTCYMNSVIQCLNNTIPLAQFFMKNSYSDNINENSKQKGMVAEELAAVIRSLWSGHYKSISMWDLKNIVAKHHKSFYGFDQQDAHEFLLKLMDWLNEDLNMIKWNISKMTEQNFEKMPDYLAAEKVMNEMNSRENSIIRTLFHGLHQSVITCTICSHRSITFESFSVLTVSLPTNSCSLVDQIREYYTISEIEYKCARCKKQRICTRKMNIWQLPPVLVIHLNRFEHDVLMKKNPNFVNFPTENLNLAPYVVSSTNKYEYFNLYAISNHYGTMDGGHYTAFCHSKRFGWLKFDDNEVYELPMKDVKTTAAYILFYQAANINSFII